MEIPSNPKPYEAIPRAPRSRILGSIPHFMAGGYEFLDRAHACCGDLFVVDLKVNELVAVASPEAAERVLVSESKNYDKGAEFWELGRDALGNGLALSDGDLWRRQRRLMNPAFRMQRLKGLRQVIEEVVEHKVAELEVLAAEGDLDISRWTSDVLSTLTGRLLIGSSIPGPDFDRFKDALQILTASAITGFVTKKLPSWLPLPGSAKFQQAKTFVSETVLKIIDERRASGRDDNDLLGMLLVATDDDGTMSNDQLRDEVVVTYIAGYETTAWALAWGLRLLARHPEILQEVQDSLRRHRDPLENPVLRCNFMEMLRLYPSAPLLPRRAVVDGVLDGYRIPKDTTVVVLPWLIHRNPRIWDHPLEFDPKRHLDDHDRHRLSWMPFGAGQRLCVGKGLAMMEAQIILDRVLRKFRPATSQKHELVEPKFSATLSSPIGVWVRMLPREEAIARPVPPTAEGGREMDAQGR
jgi:cytochrome P450